MTTRITDSTRIRLLVLAPNWLGDVVMHTPLLSLLDASRSLVRDKTGKNLELTLGLSRAWAGLFENDTRIDDRIILERTGRHGGVGGAFRLASVLKQGNFDAVLLCPPSLRTGLAAWLARIPSRVGYRTDGRSLLLTRGISPLPRGDEHYSREMTRLGEEWLTSLGLEPPAGENGPWTTSLPGCENVAGVPGGSGRPFWVVAPGTTYGEAKSWPLDKVRHFMSLATGKSGVRVVLLGDGAARGFTDELRPLVPAIWGDSLSGEYQVVDLTGRTDLLEAVSILKSCSAFIGNDSGLMHVASALGRPTVGVFGSSNPDWTSPLGPASRAVVPRGFDCRPCYRKTCNQAEFCLDTVEAETVLSAVLQIAAEPDSRPEDS